MKKRMIAWALLLCLALTACTPAANTTGATTGKTDPTGENITTGESNTTAKQDPTTVPTDPTDPTTDPTTVPTEPTDPTATPTEPTEPTNEPTLKIHYQRVEDDYDEWGFWIWQQGGEGSLYEMNGRDNFGGIAEYPLSSFGTKALEKGIGIIPRRLDGWTKDCNEDRLIDFSAFTPDADNCYHLYIIQGDPEVYMDNNFSVVPTIMAAQFTSWSEMLVQTNVAISKAVLYADGVELVSVSVENLKKVTVTLPEGVSAEMGKAYEVEVTYADSGETARSAVSFAALYGTDSFNELYYYDGELGALYTKEKTEFKVWSPVSSSIKLNIYDMGKGGELLESVEMERGEKGVFSITLEGDYAGKYYTYTVTNADHPTGTEVVDPYAKSAGVNGLRGMIVDFSVTNPAGWDEISPIGYDRKELVVWETHVADVTSSDTWGGNADLAKTFLGMIQQGTTYTDPETGVTVTTGFDHIKELGVNAVQLVPIFDQANDETNVSFNWGYNPLNYNVLEGAYSTNAEDGYVRINEFKQLVQAFNDAGINIIMDVVYNHVSSAVGSNFDVLMPGYYFRYNSDGTLSNGSGCGNELASDNRMVRKFIIDSVCFWAEEYKLGGFRFDLMGLHDIDTMNELAAALREINPDIVIYGEPWEGGSTTLSSSLQSDQSNITKLDGVGAFNDQMRDALIKGGLNSNAAKGWITNDSSVSSADVAKILQGLLGQTNSSIKDPNQTVNYVTCHDNYTLYDRIIAAGITDEETIRKMAVLANAVVMTSNGTSFMLAGEEFLRTKGGNGNSYDSSYEVNELNYALKVKNADVFENYKALIAFKKSMASLHLEQDEMSVYQAEKMADGSVIRITFVEEGYAYVIIHANGTVNGYSENLEDYELLLDTLGETELTAETAIGAYQTVIARKPVE